MSSVKVGQLLKQDGYSLHKSNEISAVLEPIDTLDLKGSVVTADAMCCQIETAKKIIEKEADYILKPLNECDRQPANTLGQLRRRVKREGGGKLRKTQVNTNPLFQGISRVAQVVESMVNLTGKTIGSELEKLEKHEVF